MPNCFEPLREQLLCAGIAPRRVDRYLCELADHLADLTAEEQSAGHAADAVPRALARLGSADSLAVAMIARPELCSWSARRPCAAYLLAPSLALVLGLALSVAILVAVAGTFRPGGSGLSLPAWFPGFATTLTVGTPLVLPILLAWALAAHATRRRMKEYWPLLGLATLGILGGAVGIDLSLPSLAGPGELNVNLALLPPFCHLGTAGTRMAANLVLSVAPYIAVRHRGTVVAA